MSIEALILITSKFCIYGQQTSALGKILSSFFANEACLANFDIILS